MGIVHQHDVVTRIMRLNEIHLKDECLFLTVDDDEIEMVNVSDHGENFAALWAKEILGDPVLKVFRLSDIDDRLLFVSPEVDAA